MFKSIGEINIICSDLERSLKFYTEVLGFTIREYEDGAVHLEGASQAFLLLPIAQPVDDHPRYGSVPTISFDLFTDNLDAAVAHFKAHNVSIITDWQPGGNACFIRDPDGLVIEVLALL